MRAFNTFLFVLQAIVAAAAATPDTVKWTLAKSCYKAYDFTAETFETDDDELADSMVASFQQMKDWADRAVKKIDDSISKNPFKGKATKDTLMALIGSGDYKVNAQDVRDKLSSLAKLDGPIGKDGDNGGKYVESDAWKTLESGDEHYWNFVISCRPELGRTKDTFGIMDVPYDNIRKERINPNALLQRMLHADQEEENPANTVRRPSAITIGDSQHPPEGERRQIPQTINFSPLWIKKHRDVKFDGWTDDLFKQVTAVSAPEVFRKQEGGTHDLRPIDGLLTASATRDLFQEVFQLKAFGEMNPDMRGAYLWAVNTKNQNRDNPDLLAIIATVIELLNRDGQKYKVSAEGAVTPR